MTNKNIGERIFRPARQEAHDAKVTVDSPQTHSASYKLAFQDTEFLLREDLRPVRFQLELMKPEVLLDEANIVSTFVFYGSARIPSPDKAQALIDAARSDQDRRIANNLAAKARYYDEARKLAQTAAAFPPNSAGCRHFVVCSGGGPSIMEAANRGAHDAGAPSIGFNITLPMEQEPNAYSTPDLTFRFHYFAMRKMHLAMRANALVVFPGGFGTLDELFEILTLQQTNKAPRIPTVLVDEAYWTSIIDFRALAAAGMVTEADLALFRFAADAEEAWERLQVSGAINGRQDVKAPRQVR